MAKMKNMSDLADRLFDELEKFDNEEMTDEEFEHAVIRNNAILNTADRIISIARVAVDARRVDDNLYNGAAPKLLVERDGDK